MFANVCEHLHRDKWTCLAMNVRWYSQQKLVHQVKTSCEQNQDCQWIMFKTVRTCWDVHVRKTGFCMLANILLCLRGFGFRQLNRNQVTIVWSLRFNSAEQNRTANRLARKRAKIKPTGSEPCLLLSFSNSWESPKLPFLKIVMVTLCWILELTLTALALFANLLF